MKGKNYIFTYLSTLIIGILLLIFHDRETLYNTVVLIIGILIAVPSLILFITTLVRKGDSKESPGLKNTIKLTSSIASLVGLGFGVWMIANPAFFVSAIIYTLGAILILAGILQMTMIYLGAKPLRPAIGWFIIPLLTLLTGVVIVFLGPAKVSAFAGLITGIALVLYAANGFASAGKESKESDDVKKLEHLTADKDDEKAQKAEQKEEKEEKEDEIEGKDTEENKE